MYRFSPYLIYILLFAIAVISIWTPLAHPKIAQRWFAMPNMLYLLPGPLLLLFSFIVTLITLARATASPLVLTLLVIFLGYSGLGVSIWPDLVLPSRPMWQAASPVASQPFAAIGVLFTLPSFWSIPRGAITLSEAK